MAAAAAKTRSHRAVWIGIALAVVLLAVIGAKAIPPVSATGSRRGSGSGSGSGSAGGSASVGEATVQAADGTIDGAGSMAARAATMPALRVLKALPHDRNAFTQGLVFLNGVLYESTGLYGRSTVRKVDPETGKVLSQTALKGKYFGEGLAVHGQELIQITWKEKTAFVYDLETLQEKRSFTYTTDTTEGWGLACNGSELAVTDGSATVYFWDVHTMQEVRRIRVRSDQGQDIIHLNELEFVNGELWANVWYQDFIVRINPANGDLIGVLDMSEVRPKSKRGPMEDCLNGIAYDAATSTVYVTGKQWPKLYKLEYNPEA